MADADAGFPPPRLLALAKRVFSLLKQRGEKVCIAETVSILVLLPLYPGS
jgi:hypothetical protein